MSLEEYTPDLDSSEGGGQSAESSREVSENFKESVKKSSAGIKRTSKDEKKAKKHDLLLANFLVKIIINKKYDSILENLFKVMNLGYPSNFLLGILSLINIEISDKIRELTGKEKIIFNYLSKELIEFDDSNLNEDIKNRINFWVEDIINIISIEYSSILSKKLKTIINNDEELLNFTSQVFSFFLKEININIAEKKAIGISEFILSEIEGKIKKLETEEI